MTLDDKYVLESGRVYLTGTQALVRLPMMQRQRDLAAGLNTGRLHLRLSRLAARRLRPGAVAGQEVHQEAPHRVPAQHQRGPGRDGTWGTQQIHLYPGARYDGVFGIWYGKAPASIARATR